MTEDEARQKRCCGPEGCGWVYESEIPGGAIRELRYCIGSACMGWRVKPGQFSIGKLEQLGVVVKEPADTGYCGLAGAP